MSTPLIEDLSSSLNFLSLTDREPPPTHIIITSHMKNSKPLPRLFEECIQTCWFGCIMTDMPHHSAHEHLQSTSYNHTLTANGNADVIYLQPCRISRDRAGFKSKDAGLQNWSSRICNQQCFPPLRSKLYINR